MNASAPIHDKSALPLANTRCNAKVRSLMLPVYALITPARNEAQFIELTIKSVVAQVVPPVRWIIVSDGSTDGTDDIVAKYAADHSFIRLIRTPERKERHFAGKVQAFNAGLAALKDVEYQVIASLDGDISFGADYFSFLLKKIADDPGLGLVGTPFADTVGGTYDYRFVSPEHVSGACQVFRRECFEAIGGYVPVKGGSIDHIAVITARMKGWKTRTFTDHVCLHHRAIGTAQHSALAAKFKYGIKDYAMGNHPIWELFRTAYQITKRPIVLGGVALLSGYLSAFLRGSDRPVSQQLVAFHRREQMQRLKHFFSVRKVSDSGTLERMRSLQKG